MVYLHIGLNRTATTFLQDAFFPTLEGVNIKKKSPKCILIVPGKSLTDHFGMLFTEKIAVV